MLAAEVDCAPPTDQCSDGRSLAYQAQTAASTAVVAPAIQKELRQPKRGIIQAKRDGESALPIPAPPATNPQTKPCRVLGNQFAFIRPQAGYRGAVQIPTRKRTNTNAGTIPSSDPRPGRAPRAVKPVNRAAPKPIAISVRHGPSRSVK